MSDDNGILSNHRWQRTKLVPPMMDSLGDNLELIQWKYELVPEIIWIGELLEKTKPERAVEIVQECSETADEVVENGNYVLLRDYDQLEDPDIKEFQTNLNDNITSNLSNYMSTLARVYPSLPIGQFLDYEGGESPDNDDL